MIRRKNFPRNISPWCPLRQGSTRWPVETMNLGAIYMSIACFVETSRVFMLLMMVFWWWYVLHVLVDDFWGMVPKVPFNFNCGICGKEGQRFRRISLRAIERIFFKTGGWSRQSCTAPSEKLFFPNQAVQGWRLAMMALAKDHEISRKWAKNWWFPSKKYPLVNKQNYGKSPFIIGRFR